MRYGLHIESPSEREATHATLVVCVSKLVIDDDCWVDKTPSGGVDEAMMNLAVRSVWNGWTPMEFIV